MNKYKILEIIGDGTYGTVYKGVNLQTNEKVAIKKLKNKIKSWEECVNMSEVRILKDLHHENIVKLHEIIREQNSEVSYIFEFADINLFEYIEQFRKRNEPIPEYKIKKIIYQIICGLKYLHDKGIIHRDLKPENILIMQDTNLVKLADFGTARELPSVRNGNMTDYVCTRWYRAPECILKSTEYDEKTDIWAVGCIMCELYNLKPIFPGNSEFDQLTKVTSILGTPDYNYWPEGFKLAQKLGLKFPNCNKADLNLIVKGCCSEAIRMLEDIFVWDPLNRASAQMLLNSKYFNDYRPGTYSFPKRINKVLNPISTRGRSGRLIGSELRNAGLNEDRGIEDNTTNFNIFNRGYESSINNIENSKNENYLRNLNYRNYQNNGGIIPDLNSIFNKDVFSGNSGFGNGNNNNIYKGNMFNRNYFNDNNKTKLSTMAENSIFNRKNNFSRNTNLNGAGYLPPILGGAERGNFYYNNNNSAQRGYSNNAKFYNRPVLGRMNNYNNELMFM